MTFEIGAYLDFNNILRNLITQCYFNFLDLIKNESIGYLAFLIYSYNIYLILIINI